MVQVMLCINTSLLYEFFRVEPISRATVRSSPFSDVSTLVFLPHSQLANETIQDNSSILVQEEPDSIVDSSICPTPSLHVIAATNIDGVPVVVALLTNAWDVLSSFFSLKHLRSSLPSMKRIGELFKRQNKKESANSQAEKSSEKGPTVIKISAQIVSSNIPANFEMNSSSLLPTATVSASAQRGRRIIREITKEQYVQASVSLL